MICINTKAQFKNSLIFFDRLAKLFNSLNPKVELRLGILQTALILLPIFFTWLLLLFYYIDRLETL